jgi:hypothetical protein
MISDSESPLPFKIAPKFKAIPPTGIWSPLNRSEESLGEKKPPEPPPPPVWSVPGSPVPDRKFRPVPFESPTLPRKNISKAVVEPPWTKPDYPEKPVEPIVLKSSSCHNISTTKTQTPISTFLRKPRGDQFNEKTDGKIITTSTTLGTISAQKDKSIVNKIKPMNPIKSNELVYSIKRDYTSETKDDTDISKTKMTQISPKKVDGIGPITREGMPLSLRSEVKEDNQGTWYKKVYNTIHKAKDDDNYVTVKYKTRRGNYPYKSNGYASEPDANYDSDYVLKYHSVDRKRTTSIGNQYEDKYGSMEKPVKTTVGIHYKNQPGKIENYTPGNSSITDKEAEQWYREVLEVFDKQLEQQKLASNYTQGNLSRALKDSGYQSDSTLVFKKKNDVEQLSPIEQKQAYKNVQSGGEVPLHGFRKPLPEKPKESIVPPPPPIKYDYNQFDFGDYGPDSPKRYVESNVNIHYKTPVRYEYKQPIPDDELAYQQAEHMKKVYQEERRRKYLQELQDMNNRRHTDNFTPSQKSPIALNRYDDFPTNPLSKSPVNLPNTIARALYNFQGQSSRELSFKKGDIIFIRRQIDKNWYEGEHNAMIGLLPVQYVDIITNEGLSRPILKKPSEGQARAKFNFQAQSEIELSLNKGELVALTRRVDPNWFEGRIGNKKGIFPVSYVDVLTDIGADDLENQIAITTNNNNNNNNGLTKTVTTTVTKQVVPTITAGPLTNDIVRETQTIRKTETLHVDTSNDPISYRAMYNYRPVNSDELELKEGDLVYVLEQCDDGWFVGTSQRTGYFGTFPGNYVKRVY